MYQATAAKDKRALRTLTPIITSIDRTHNYHSSSQGRVWSRIATHCCTAARAFSRRTASVLLLIGWAITANGYPGLPETCAITLAVCTNRSVMTAVARIPRCSANRASCKLHDEQLPQSPTAEITASHPVICANTSGGAGRLASGFFRRTTFVTP
jgi:hypothetical protein